MSQRPEEVKLSHEEGEQLIERLETDQVTAADRAVLVKRVLPVSLRDIGMAADIR